MSTYLKQQFLKHIKDKIEIAFELGSRDCLDAIQISQHFGCKVHAFECNPGSIEKCKHNLALKDKDSMITLCEFALWNKREKIKFYPVVNGNHGASSCFRADHSYPHEKPYQQTEIEVEAITLDEYCYENNITKIDYLCADLQGAALKAFNGSTKILKNTKYLACEIERKQLYHGQDLFEPINEFLTSLGFKLLEEKPVNNYFSDFFYVNNNLKGK